ncbi:hypothetical protein [Streptomyces tremellae]|uniref:Uncharacterized protein n=1 Tax=Streptomyces tremellae TaxID=1124239 RepID=A0ABP7EH61_9ACTN
MERTDQPANDDSPETPPESQLVDEPATPENCAADYAAGSGARQAFDKHVQKYRDR